MEHEDWSLNRTKYNLAVQFKTYTVQTKYFFPENSGHIATGGVQIF